MIHYIVQTITFQLLFLVVYDLFLKKETFFNINRVYLVITPILSLILPLIQITAIREYIPAEYAIQLPAVVIGDTGSLNGLAEAYTGSSLFNLQNLWLFGGVLSVLLFGYKLNRIFKLKRTGTVSKFDKFNVIRLPGTTAAFTFFRSIFLGAELSEAQQKSILLHEKVHVLQNHSVDLLFFELLRILFWFNPLVYLFQKRMTVLQEYIADRQVAASQNNKEYYQDLLSQVFGTEKISFINTFFNHSLIKNRIVMLQRSKSKRILQLKYLLLIPLVGSMLFYSSCSDESSADAVADEANLVSNTDTEVMDKITELSEAIMKKGSLTDEELKALKFLAAERGPGDKIYESVHEFLTDSMAVLSGGTVYDIKGLNDGSLKDVPFAVIGKAPLFPGCEGQSGDGAKKCTTQKISELVSKEFNTKLANTYNLSGRQRISVQFKIDKVGNITSVRARAPHPALEQEAIRVVKALPTMIPGEHKGKAVGVLYALPIIFEVE
ncbi:MAG: M56 family metallopeptidase [Bacteroidota bacterium]